MSVQTIPDLFLNAVRNTPRPDCFSSKDDSGQYVDVSSEEALRRVRALRMGLKSLGVKTGDAVAILSENRLEWALSDLSSLCAGALTVPIYPTLLPETIEYILNDCKPVAIFVSTAEQATKIHQMRDRIPFVKDIISFDKTQLPDIMTFEKLLHIGENLVGDAAPDDDFCAKVDKDSACSIIYTSGTTGNPKGVVLSHWNFVSNVIHIDNTFDFNRDDRCLSFLPLSHVLERMAGYYTMLMAGIGIAYAERMDTVPMDIIQVKPTIIISVPRLYEKIYGKTLALAMSGSPVKKNIFFWARGVGMEHAKLTTNNQPVSGWLNFQKGIADKLVFSKLRAKLGGRIRFMVSGGAPLNKTINQFFYAADLQIMEGYGLTETSPVLSCNTPENIRFGSIGKPLHDTEIKIADDGEIMARGPQVMLGYYNNEAATAEVLDGDGWLSTGDIGHFDEDGFLFITDRKKDIIVTAGGKNIAPQPIENRYKTSKFVSMAVIIGDRRKYLTVIMVPDLETLGSHAESIGLDTSDPVKLLAEPAIQKLFEELMIEINGELPSFSQIKKFALLEREFTLEDGELTPTMKIKRFAVNKKHKTMIDQMYPAPIAGEEI
jgi:long-chain acyl-CoA synthetase